MTTCTLAAPAKLNLHLGIYAELDERRYHRADSLMVALDLADEGEVSLDKSLREPSVACEPEVDIPPQKNTAYRAAMALATRYGKNLGVRIRIAKHVPDQAGLGGSSSDAASVILSLCELWGIDSQEPLVAEAARSVGADVPFFLDPVPTLLVGAGDVVDRKFPAFAQPISVALVRPAGPGVSTPAAYAAFDEEHDDPASCKALCDVLESGRATAASIAPLLHNNLDPIACRLLFADAQVRSWLLVQPGVLGGQVSGSGSCVFGVCASDEAAREVVCAAQAHGWWAHAAHIV